MENKTEKIWNKKFILLFITNLLMMATFYASVPIIPIFCQEVGITGSKKLLCLLQQYYLDLLQAIF